MVQEKDLTEISNETLRRRLKKHANHHSDTHIRVMVQEIAAGQSFEEAHKTASKRVGE